MRLPMVPLFVRACPGTNESRSPDAKPTDSTSKSGGVFDETAEPCLRSAGFI